MTITTTANRYEAAGNGVTTVFSYASKFLADEDLVVILTDDDGVETVKTLSTHYTVSGAGDAAGGSVTMLTAPAVGETLVVYGDPTISQEVDLLDGDDLPVEASIEQPLDRLTLICQRLSDRMSRSLRLSDGNVTADPVLPAPVASSLLGWDSDAEALVNYSLGDIGADILVSSFAETVLDDTDGAAFLKTLHAGLVTTTTNSTAFAAADCGKTFVFSSTATHTFAAAATLGNGWYVQIRNNGTGVLTLDPDGSETIDGATTLKMYPGDSCLVVCNGSLLTTIGLQDQPRVISAQSPSAVATVDFTGLDATHDLYQIKFDFVPQTDDVYLFLRAGTGAGPTWQSGAGAYSWGGRIQGPAAGADTGSTIDSLDTLMVLTRAGAGQGVGSASGEHVAGTVRVWSPSNSSNQVLIEADCVYKRSDGVGVISRVGGLYGGPSVTGIRLAFSSGNVTSGWAVLTGDRKARS